MEEIEARVHINGNLQNVDMWRQGDYLVISGDGWTLYRRWSTIGGTIRILDTAYLYTPRIGPGYGVPFVCEETEQAAFPRDMITLLNDTRLVEIEGVLVGNRFQRPYFVMTEKTADAFLEWFIPSEKEVDLLGCTITDI
jgi:hypothetical protein